MAGFDSSYAFTQPAARIDDADPFGFALVIDDDPDGLTLRFHDAETAEDVCLSWLSLIAARRLHHEDRPTPPLEPVRPKSTLYPEQAEVLARDGVAEVCAAISKLAEK